MKTREELLKQLGKPSMPIEITGYVDRIERERVETDLVLVTNDEIHDILQAPTQEQLDCPYCHEPFRSLASFRVKNGRQEVYNLRVTSFDGFSNDQLDYDAIKNYQPYGDFRKFDYCPMCGRKLGDD